MLKLCKIWVKIWGLWDWSLCFEVFYAKERHQQRMSLCCNLKTHFHKYFFFMSNCDMLKMSLLQTNSDKTLSATSFQHFKSFWHNTRLVAPKIYTKSNLKRGNSFGFNNTWLVILTNFNFVEIISVRKIKFWIFLWKA